VQQATGFLPTGSFGSPKEYFKIDQGLKGSDADPERFIPEQDPTVAKSGKWKSVGSTLLQEQ
jgi:hypothetical protein